MFAKSLRLRTYNRDPITYEGDRISITLIKSEYMREYIVDVYVMKVPQNCLGNCYNSRKQKPFCFTGQNI